MCKIYHIKGNSRSQSSEDELFPNTTAEYQLAHRKKHRHLQIYSLQKVLSSQCVVRWHSFNNNNKIPPLQTKQVFQTSSYFNDEEPGLAQCKFVYITSETAYQLRYRSSYYNRKESFCPGHGPIGWSSEPWRG